VVGIFPALLVTLLFILSIYIRCRLHPKQGPPGEKFTWVEKFKSLLDLTEALIVFILVIGGIFIGLFYPYRGCCCRLGILIIAIVRRQITWEGFVKSVHETLMTSCMVLMLIAGAVIFGKFLVVTRIPFEIAGRFSGIDIPPYLVMGVVMELGYDPIWFGVIIVMVTEMGVITPPVGINVYVVYGVAKNVLKEETPLEKIFKGIFPFLLAVIAGVIILMIFP
jgi:C4-dicarboxylate transporter, DctM subunit